MVYDQNLFHQPVKNEIRTFNNLGTVAASQGDDKKAGCLLDYPYFKENCKLIAMGLRRQAFDANPIAIKQINFTGNLERTGNITKLFIIKEVKETILDFSQGTIKRDGHIVRSFPRKLAKRTFSFFKRCVPSQNTGPLTFFLNCEDGSIRTEKKVSAMCVFLSITSGELI